MKNEKDIIVAEMDCSVYRDLCGKYKITGYPTVNFYSNGKFVQKFTRDRTVENLSFFALANKHSDKKE